MTEQKSNGKASRETTRSLTVYSTHFLFNAIYVLESLGAGETKTGEELYDNVILPFKTSSIDEAYTKYQRVLTRAELLSALSEICANAKYANHKPIIHIEAHGSDDGLQLADGVSIRWRELSEQFASINEASGFNLTVVAISCKGWHLTGSLLPNDRAPVALIIGPPGNMSAADLLSATKEFYRVLFEQLDFNSALVAMNGGREYRDWSIKPATAEVLFCRVFRQYLALLASASKMSDRADQIVSALTQSLSLDVTQSMSLRLTVSKELADHARSYERLRKKFLMLDLFPSNRQRFGLNYQRCVSSVVASKTGG